MEEPAEEVFSWCLKMKQLVSLTPEDERKISHYLRALQQEYQLPTSPSLDSKMTKWASFVSEVESGYGMSIYDYASDLTNRDELQDILDLIGPQAREGLQEILRPLDDRFVSATREAAVPVVQADDLEHRSWWKRIPVKLMTELEQDLRTEGLL